MEYVEEEGVTMGKVKCCDCDILIDPNPTNMCAECLRKRIDITECIPKQVNILCCKGCNRYHKPPDQWLTCALESRELLAFCLKRLKGLKQVNLVDASFIWTEPHSKRIKVKVVVQKEAYGVILQQELVVEYIVGSLMCTDCHRTEAKNFWRAVVQLRQRVQHKKTFFFLEQLILKHNMHSNCLNIRSASDGLDFYFAKRDDARKMVEFFSTVAPCRSKLSQQLISHDTHSNIFDYKFTYSVELAPVCKNDVVCLPLSLSRSLGNIGQVCICHRVTNSIYLIDPSTLQLANVSGNEYWRTPFSPIGSIKQFIEYTVMDITYIQDSERVTFTGQGHTSHKHVLADAWVVRSSELGITESMIHTRTHLGHLLKPGDIVLGLELSSVNVNNVDFNKIDKERIPDVVLVKKIYEDKTSRHKRRMWKLKHLNIETDTDNSSVQRDFDEFLEDLEEDEVYRHCVNIYKDPVKLAMAQLQVDHSDIPDDLPQITLQDMLDDLTLEEDATGEEGGAMLE